MAVTRNTKGEGRRKTSPVPSLAAKNREYRQSSKAPSPKAVNATTRALRSKSTNPTAAARSMKVAKGASAEKALAMAQVRISDSKSKIRKVARRAVRKGMSPGSPGGGLSLTKDEGSRGLQRAVKTVGYKQARKISAKVAKKRSR